MNKPQVCVIILSWNRKQDTLETIKSLSASNTKGFELEIMVVDNGSTDGSAEALRQLKTNNSKLITIFNKKNLGFAQGNNVGMRSALKRGFDYIALLNVFGFGRTNLLEVFTTRFRSCRELCARIAILNAESTVFVYGGESCMI